MRRVLGLTLFLSLACSSGTDSQRAASPGDQPEAGASAATTSPAVAPTKDGDDGLIDGAAYFNGGRELDAEGNADLNHAAVLFNRQPEGEWACSQSERCDVVIELSEPWDLEKLVVVAGDDPLTAPKKLAVEVGPTATGPWTEVAAVTVASGKTPQSFPLTAKAARFAHLVFREWSPGEYVVLDDVQLRGRRSTSWSFDWNGTWHDESNNFIELHQQGDRVTGCYGDNSRIEGVVDGSIFTGTIEVDDNTPRTKGRFIVAMTPDHGLRGVWSESTDPLAPMVNRHDARWHGEPVAMHCDEPSEQQPDALETAFAKDGRVVLYGVLFDFDKDTLKPESDAVLQALAKAILAHPDQTFRIEGHTDNKGGDAYNLDLSASRAKAVETWLVAHGCADDHLETHGFGASSPILPNDTAAGRTQNRRVEVAIVQ